jgi:two-component system cell cycle response regulator DivK
MDALAGLPVLVVDDNELDLKLMLLVLVSAGCEVRTARSSKGALEVLQTFAARVVLTDVRMPDEDGLALTRRLKADPATRDLVVVAVTAFNRKPDALAAGCDAFINKPIDVNTIGDDIRALLAAVSGRRGS